MTLKHGISPTQGSLADVNLALKIDMRCIDIDGSLEHLHAMARSTDGLEAKPSSFPALLSVSILSLKVLDFRCMLFKGVSCLVSKIMLPC